MINSVHIENSQSHKDTYIEFDSGLNVIVGETDSGKSALLRSLRYAIWNKPNSKVLLSNWGGVLRVELNIDGNLIVRESGNKELYKLNDLEFNSFGTKVPVEIEKIINMTEINSQEQIDQFFLLTETPGYVASYLNKIANLEQIDEVTKSIKSELNETKRLIEHQKNDLKSKEAELESFSFLSTFKQDLDEADALQLRVSDTETKISTISYAIKQIKQCNKGIAINKELAELKENVNSALGLIKEINEFEIHINKIDWYINYVSDIDTEINELSKLIDLKLIIAETLELKKEQSDKEAKLDSLETAMTKLSSINKKIELKQAEIEQDKEVYETELHKLGKCFFCGQKLK